ncbi:MAG: 16S rRNA (guanine(966)-N(2))-methyltransferase RsmD [Clostridiales bacterium]|jgi:16S rRNA (guanine(966)-N(2))-methyltransferase RsmD|nr:16S rRNA (guanine(966)-N(2))-methyltransferase RsmD [Clostridiales bacterium]
MRVISGQAGGFALFSPKGKNVRPTSDMVKEAVFNMLSPHIDGAAFLDLFCGTGAAGIEALSRGAKRAVFVDNSKDSITFTEKNLQHTKLMPNAELVLKSATEFLKGNKEKFDIIFMDPPYSKGFIIPVLELIKSTGALKEGGLCVTEYPASENHEVSFFEVYKNKRYGRIKVLIYRALREN